MNRKRTSKLLLLAVMTLFSFTKSHSQVVSKKTIDTSYIIYKAKLLTLVGFGVSPPDSMLNGLQSQVDSIIYPIDDEYMIIKIRLNQQNKIQLLNNSTVESFCLEHFRNSCSFLVVFSFISGRFYRIQGFDVCDFEQLNSECKMFNHPIDFVFFSGNSNLINIDCYKKKYIRHRKSKECHLRCTECNQLEVY